MELLVCSSVVSSETPQTQRLTPRINKYCNLCFKSGIDFMPITFSAHRGVTLDTFHFSLDDLINKVKKSAFVASNRVAANKKEYWLQCITIALWSGILAQLKSMLAHGF